MRVTGRCFTIHTAVGNTPDDSNEQGDYADAERYRNRGISPICRKTPRKGPPSPIQQQQRETDERHTGSQEGLHCESPK